MQDLFDEELFARTLQEMFFYEIKDIDTAEKLYCILAGNFLKDEKGESITFISCAAANRIVALARNAAGCPFEEPNEYLQLERAGEIDEWVRNKLMNYNLGIIKQERLF
jgi:hypothetical protein